MIARKYSQPTRIERQRTVYPIFSAEVRDGILFRYTRSVRRRSPQTRVAHISLKGTRKPGDAFDVKRVGGHLGQPELRCLAQQEPCVLFRLVPDSGVEIAKDCSAVGRPAPPIIRRKSFKRLQGRWQLGLMN